MVDVKQQISFSNDLPTLYIVATPIGNLGDFSQRAIDTLKSVDYILVEDSRVSAKLLNHFQISKPLILYHDFNKDTKENHVLSFLKDNKNLALISDAGTPMISDPGYEIAGAVIKAGFNVVAIPGASAILTALCVSGLVTQPFTFLGFLPKKDNALRQLLKDWASIPTALVCFESPNRIVKTIGILKEILVDRQVCIARELTKKFETIIRANIKDINPDDLILKGEYVIVIEAASTQTPEYKMSVYDHVMQNINQGLSKNDAIKKTAKERKVTKNDVYQEYLKHHSNLKEQK